MIVPNSKIQILILVGMIVSLAAVATPVLADCTIQSNATGGQNWVCNNQTTGVINGSPGSDNITNYGTLSGYIWSAGFRSVTTQQDTIVNYGTVGDGQFNIESNEDDDGIWGSAGNDTIINYGVVQGGAAGAIFGDGSLATAADYDIIIHNGTAYGDINGDFQARGHDTITINGQVVGSVYGDVAPALNGYTSPSLQNTGGNDVIILQNNANVSGYLDGNLGTDTLRFEFTTANQSEKDALSALITAASPSSGQLTFKGVVHRWRNFELLQNGIVVAGSATATLTPTNTNVPPTATFTPTNTNVPPTATFTPTNTNVPPTATFTAMFTPTNTNVPPTETLTPTNTEVAPTATLTPTNTNVPPTATLTPTNTNVPPTATLTPTNTNVPPTATFTATNTPTLIPTATNTAVVGGNGTVTLQINSGNDDVNEDGSSYVSNYVGIWAGTAGSASASLTGLRFNNIAIPRSATITSARLEIYSAGFSQWVSMSFQLAGDASDNSLPFSASNRPSQRPLTLARLNHSTNAQWNASSWYVLNDVQVVVQEIVNRAGWQSGNSLSFVLRGTGATWSRKYGYAFEADPAYAIRLVITYTQ